MQITISGQNIDVTPSLKEYVEGKFERIERHFDHVIDAHVVLDVDKREQHAEATLNVSGKTLFAEAANHDMYAAVDLMIDKLDRQVRDHKEKVTNHHHEVPHKSLHVS